MILRFFIFLHYFKII